MLIGNVAHNELLYNRIKAEFPANFDLNKHFSVAEQHYERGFTRRQLAEDIYHVSEARISNILITYNRRIVPLMRKFVKEYGVTI